MNKTVLTINGKDYPTDNLNYNIYRKLGSENGVASQISLSIQVSGKNDLDLVMAKGQFDCAVTVFDESGGILKYFAFENVEITSYNYATGYYCNVQMKAKAVTFDGIRVIIEKESEM